MLRYDLYFIVYLSINECLWRAGVFCYLTNGLLSPGKPPSENKGFIARIATPLAVRNDLLFLHTLLSSHVKNPKNIIDRVYTEDYKDNGKVVHDASVHNKLSPECKDEST